MKWNLKRALIATGIYAVVSTVLYVILHRMEQNLEAELDELWAEFETNATNTSYVDPRHPSQT